MDPLIEIGEPHRAANEKDISICERNKTSRKRGLLILALPLGEEAQSPLACLFNSQKSTTATSSPQIELIYWMLIWSPSKIEDRHHHKGLNPLGE